MIIGGGAISGAAISARRRTLLYTTFFVFCPMIPMYVFSQYYVVAYQTR